jgi:hypothetical protein
VTSSNTPAILIDLDGTLTDPEEGIVASLRYAQLLHTTDTSLIERATRAYRERFEERGMFENRVFDGARESLERFVASGYELVLAKIFRLPDPCCGVLWGFLVENWEELVRARSELPPHRPPFRSY